MYPNIYNMEIIIEKHPSISSHTTSNQSVLDQLRFATRNQSLMIKTKNNHKVLPLNHYIM